VSKILLVEDDLKTAEDLTEWFRREGHTVDSVVSGAEALEWLKSYEFDVIILDWKLPDLDGVSVCRLYRHSGGKTPVLLLTGRNETESKEMGLDSGADDYVVKPPDMRELSARIRALLRRGTNVAPSVMRFGEITLMPASRKVSLKGQEIDLSPKEYAVLEYMMRHQGIVFSAADLLDRVWKSDSEASYHTVRVCINRLRQKLFTEQKEKGPTLRTVYGVGYILE
jgi:DNA-binding response OmpR family regulator